MAKDRPDFPPAAIKRHKKYCIFCSITVLFVILLNLLSLNRSFCDFCTNHLFRFISMPYAAVTKLFPFSFGELLIAIGILIVLILIIWSLIYAIRSLTHRIKKKPIPSGKHLFLYIRITFGIILIVLLLMTLNCSIPYGCSKYYLTENKDGDLVGADYTPTLEETRILRNFLVEETNRLAETMERDENGYVILPGCTYEESAEKVLLLSMDAVKKRSGSDSRFSGLISHPKFLASSYLMYETNMLGYYFPFSMEANLSKYITPVNLPATACHELSHLAGYMFEDEANFMSFLACTNSENDFLIYSGYLEALRYVNNDFFESVDYDDYLAEPFISPLVQQDFRYYTEEDEARLQETEERLTIKKETLTEIRQGFTDTYMKYYRATENYNAVTKYLLRYYKEILY